MQYRETEKGYIIRLARGERVMETLTYFCREQGIESGLLQGIGAVKNAELGYYDLGKREYIFTHYPSDMEVISMTGNVALVEGGPFIHAHIVLSDTDNRAHGGHLKEAEVAVTLEVFLSDYGAALEREYDEETGLKLFRL